MQNGQTFVSEVTGRAVWSGKTSSFKSLLLQYASFSLSTLWWNEEAKKVALIIFYYEAAPCNVIGNPLGLNSGKPKPNLCAPVASSSRRSPAWLRRSWRRRRRRTPARASGARPTSTAATDTSAWTPRTTPTTSVSGKTELLSFPTKHLESLSILQPLRDHRFVVLEGWL